MSTWEDRMAGRAAKRRAAAQAAERERQEAEWEAERAAEEERARPAREAGPPGGCHECWSWGRQPWPLGPGWVHGPCVQPGPPPGDLEPDSDLRDSPEDYWCHHPCHDEPHGGLPRPWSCVPIAY